MLWLSYMLSCQCPALISIVVSGSRLLESYSIPSFALMFGLSYHLFLSFSILDYGSLSLYILDYGSHVFAFLSGSHFLFFFIVHN